MAVSSNQTAPTVCVSTSIPRAAHDELERRAVARNTSKAALMRELIEKFLQSENVP